MKKLKFLALGLVAAFGFAACGEEEGEEGVDYTTTSKAGCFIAAGSNNTAGSYLNQDGTVYKAADIKANGSTGIILTANVVDGVASIYSGTDAACVNGYVNGTYADAGVDKNGEAWSTKASETKLTNIKKRKAEAADIYTMDASKFTATNVEVEEGDYIAFYNETLGIKGWFYVNSIVANTEDRGDNQGTSDGVSVDFTIVTLK